MIKDAFVTELDHFQFEDSLNLNEAYYWNFQPHFPYLPPVEIQIKDQLVFLTTLYSSDQGG